MDTAKDGPYICEQCQKVFKTKITLTSHLLQVHTDDHQKTYLASRDHKYKCEPCDKTFIYKGSLTRHQRVHSGERPWLCNQCGKKFTQNDGLQRHLKVHADERSFICMRCDKTFRRKHHLKKHTNTIHRDNRSDHYDDRLPIKCWCDERFDNSEHLSDHHKNVHDPFMKRMLAKAQAPAPPLLSPSPFEVNNGPPFYPIAATSNFDINTSESASTAQNTETNYSFNENEYYHVQYDQYGRI